MTAWQVELVAAFLSREIRWTRERSQAAKLAAVTASRADRPHWRWTARRLERRAQALEASLDKVRA